nr:MAG: hypothetical protein [Lokiarchaeota virus Skoll Meg22_1214]
MKTEAMKLLDELIQTQLKILELDEGLLKRRIERMMQIVKRKKKMSRFDLMWRIMMVLGKIEGAMVYHASFSPHEFHVEFSVFRGGWKTRTYRIYWNEKRRTKIECIHPPITPGKGYKLYSLYRK